MSASSRRRVFEELERRALLAASVNILSGPFLDVSSLQLPADSSLGGDSASRPLPGIPFDPPPSDPAPSVLSTTHLTIVPTFDSTITSDPSASTIMATINQAILNYEERFSDPVTIPIKFQKMGSGLGASSAWFFVANYSGVRNALVVDSSTSDDATALAHLPNVATNPVNGTASVSIKWANLLAIGTNPGATPDGFAGTISLNTSICNLTRPPGDLTKFDLLSVTEHEMDEVLGLGSALDGGLANPFMQDLYRYNNAGARSFTTISAVSSFFSIDTTTLLARQNQTAGADFGDWFTGAAPPQVQDAFGTAGATPDLGVELTALDAIGYTRTPRAIWTGLGDGINWTDANNWSISSLPNSSDDAIVSIAANPSIQLASGTQTIHSLTCDEALTISGGTLSVASASQITATLALNSGTITGAGDLTVTSAMSWAGGTMTGTGRTIISSSANLNITGTGARSSPRPLQVDGQATVALSGSLVPILGSLTIGAAGKFNLMNNPMIIDYTGGSPVSTIGGYVTTGFNSGAWNGVGINSSTAASTPGTAVGFGEATDIFSSFPASFAGQSVDNTSVLVRYTLVGDATLDKTTDTVDFNILVANFSKAGRRWTQADFNFNQTTDTIDFNLLSSKFSQSLPAPLFGARTITNPLTDLI